jgi:peptidoglycan/xylan/chitin deacetylase (PgdA/CDA1 family)
MILVSLVLSASALLAAPKTVYLTFDDGPHANTAYILQALAEVKDSAGKAAPAKATFFLVRDNWVTWVGSQTGSAAEKEAKSKEAQKKMFLKILDAGHKVGNHTATHKPYKVSQYDDDYSDPLTVPQKKIFKENLSLNEDWFKTLSGKTDFKFPYSRLPGAGGNLESKKYLRTETTNLGWPHKTWNFEFAPNKLLDWVPNDDWQGLTGVACSHTTLPPDKAIILFHDSHWGSKDLVLSTLNFLKSKGYEFALFD